MERPRFSRSDGNRVVRVTVAGELDMATVPELEQVLCGAEAEAVIVILDLCALESIDSTAAHLMFAADRRIRLAGGLLLVARTPACVELIDHSDSGALTVRDGVAAGAPWQSPSETPRESHSAVPQ